MKKTNIVLVDDHALLREGIASMFNDIAHLTIVGKAASGEEAINMAREMEPDLILMDIMMAGMTGIEAARWIKEEYPQMKIILLSSEVKEEFVSLGIKAGIDGYLPKNVDKHTLIEAVTKVSDGEKFFNQTVTNIIVESYYKQENTTESEKVENKTLTKREHEVLEQVAHGKSNKEVADTLFISIKTVETHKTNILTKLGLKNTTELVKYAIKNNIIEL